MILIVVGALGRIPKGSECGLKKMEIKGSITQKNPEDLRKLVVTPTVVKDHQLTQE